MSLTPQEYDILEKAVVWVMVVPTRQLGNHGHICEMFVAFNRGHSHVTLEHWRKRRDHNGNLNHQTNARVRESAKGARVSYRGDTIYSYHYWPMAKFFRNARQEQCAIVRTDTYSNSTSKHQSYTRRSLDKAHVTCFYTSGPPCTDHHENAKDYQQRIAESFAKALRARDHTVMYVNEASRLYQELQAYCTFFDWPMPALVQAVDVKQREKLETKLMKRCLTEGGVVHAFWRES
jgi:hypothetical protein